MRPTSEVYPSAPLQLVAFEIRFPLVRKMTAAESTDSVQEGLDGFLPIYEPVTQRMVAPGHSSPGPSSPSSRDLDNGFRLLSRSRMTAATFLPGSLILETTDYVHYEGFRAELEKVLGAFEGAVKIAGVERCGLRYIDEIRLPRPQLSPRDWLPYISPALLGPLDVAGRDLAPSRVEGTLQFDLEGSRNVVLRYGALEGEVVTARGSLRLRPKPHTGHFFLMDIDSFWLPADGLQEFSVAATLDLCDQLRKPTRRLFEGSITELLRNEVFRKERAG